MGGIILYGTLSPFTLYESFTHIPIERTGKASTGIIGSMVPDGQGIWLGSDDLGITYYNPVTRTQQYYELYNGETPLVECKPLLIHKGALWVGTESMASTFLI